MSSALCIPKLALILVLCASANCQCTINHWQRNTDFDDKLPAGVSAMTSYPAATRRACAVHCSDRHWCLSFFYNVKTSQCVFLYTTYTPQTTDHEVVGSRYYALDKGVCKEDAGYTIDWQSCTCFRVVIAQKKWREARDLCRQDNGTLAILEPVEKAAFVQFLLLSGGYPIVIPYFIGASRPENQWDVPSRPQDLTFVWENGQTMDRAATTGMWSPFDPDGMGLQNVVAVTGSGQWMDANDSLLSSYICERAFSLY